MTNQEKQAIYDLYLSGLDALEISEKVSGRDEYPFSEKCIWDIIDEMEEE